MQDGSYTSLDKYAQAWLHYTLSATQPILSKKVGGEQRQTLQQMV